MSISPPRAEVSIKRTGWEMVLPFGHPISAPILQYAPQTLGENVTRTRTVVVAWDIRASIWHVECIQHPDGTESIAIFGADPHRVALLAVGDGGNVVDLEDDISSIVYEGEVVEI